MHFSKAVVCSLSIAVVIVFSLSVAMAANTNEKIDSVLVTQGITPTDAQPTPVVEPTILQPTVLQPAMEIGTAVELCCPKPCIKYKHHRRRLKECCTCDPPFKTVLLVKNPNGCECCFVDIPVCIPACCIDAPCIDERCGILGRGIVTYKYCCGFEIKIIFRARGDIVVHCYGG